MNISDAISFRINAKLISIVIALVILSILQDLIYSRLQNTGFYISESLLYNTIWLFCIPFLFVIRQLFKNLQLSTIKSRLFLLIALALACSLIHVLVFASTFCLVSALAFETPHRFSRILNSALSKQLYVLFLIYTLTPLILKFWKEEKKVGREPNFQKIVVRKGLAKVTLAVNEIICVTTDKPYTVIITNDQKFYDSRSLKELEQILDAKLFRRVHKSFIINKRQIVELRSRKNGDYDAELSNEVTVRFSRHLKNNWADLLLHSA